MNLMFYNLWVNRTSRTQIIVLFVAHVHGGHTLPWFVACQHTSTWCLQDGGTPLFVACQCNHQDVVEELLNHGADIHSQMIDGATSLFITAQNGHFKLLKYLISQGADVNLRRKVRNDGHLRIIVKVMFIVLCWERSIIGLLIFCSICINYNTWILWWSLCVLLIS